jgi:hypothetical protein
MYTFTDLSPLGISFIYQGLFGSGSYESLCRELKGTHCQENHHHHQQQTLFDTVQLTQEFTLQA